MTVRDLLNKIVDIQWVWFAVCLFNADHNTWDQQKAPDGMLYMKPEEVLICFGDYELDGFYLDGEDIVLNVRKPHGTA